jgi:hypothetical protein
MKTRVALAMVVCACGAACATQCCADVRFEPQLLGLQVVASDGGPMLAQRTIEREWGLSEDSVYVVKDVPGIKSEMMAGLMSAGLPGTGQMYVGGTSNMRRGAVFALAEVVALTARIMLQQEGDRVRKDAAAFAGVPTDTTSAWSLQRWAHATQSDPADLQRLYEANPEEFYDVIEGDPKYMAGWAGDAEANQQHFFELRASSDRKLNGAHVSQSFLWVNHVVAAFDAFRSARVSNMALGPALGLKVKTGFKRGRPEFMAILSRKF